MEKIKVSTWRKKRILLWLAKDEFYQANCCPFFKEKTKPTHQFCKSWFPKVKISDSRCIICPCHVYSLSHVIRTAKIMVKN